MDLSPVAQDIGYYQFMRKNTHFFFLYRKYSRGVMTSYGPGGTRYLPYVSAEKTLSLLF